jgi:hypothetical protein
MLRPCKRSHYERQLAIVLCFLTVAIGIECIQSPVHLQHASRPIFSLTQAVVLLLGEEDYWRASVLRPGFIGGSDGILEGLVGFGQV